MLINIDALRRFLVVILRGPTFGKDLIISGEKTLDVDVDATRLWVSTDLEVDSTGSNVSGNKISFSVTYNVSDEGS